jgi:hypothetical protein
MSCYCFTLLQVLFFVDVPNYEKRHFFILQHKLHLYVCTVVFLYNVMIK